MCQSIPQPTTVDCIHRETSTLAQVHHPNLVFFIAAVIDDQTGPMMITKILDTNLHTTYESNILVSNKLWIFQDVASALRLQESIIHRNVSSANALLKAVVNNRKAIRMAELIWCDMLLLLMKESVCLLG